MVLGNTNLTDISGLSNVSAVGLDVFFEANTSYEKKLTSYSWLCNSGFSQIKTMDEVTFELVPFPLANKGNICD